MANTIVECLRRVSYAGSSVENPNPNRRVSYAGQTGGNKFEPPCNSSESVTSCNNSNNAKMLDGLVTVNRVPAQQLQSDSNRNVRRSNVNSRSSDDGFACSQQSILSAMDRFVKSVNNMDATVLVPSRLRDMDFDSAVKGRPPVGFSTPDLYSFYTMLKDVKTELLWGSAMGAASSMLGPLIMTSSGRSTPSRQQSHHSRQPSDDSMGSTGSASDQDTDSDLDSVLTDRDTCDEQTSHIAVAFRFHLQGLHSILHQLADSADYLAARYNAEVDSSSL